VKRDAITTETAVSSAPALRASVVNRFSIR
jgi:hypothetical protein